MTKYNHYQICKASYYSLPLSSFMLSMQTVLVSLPSKLLSPYITLPFNFLTRLLTRSLQHYLAMSRRDQVSGVYSTRPNQEFKSTHGIRNKVRRALSLGPSQLFTTNLSRHFMES